MVVGEDLCIGDHGHANLTPRIRRGGAQAPSSNVSTTNHASKLPAVACSRRVRHMRRKNHLASVTRPLESTKSAETPVRDFASPGKRCHRYRNWGKSGRAILYRA